MDWVYGQAIGFLGNFFALMGNMGVELFELEWVSAIILFFSRLAWALFAVSVVVCAFECGIEYSTGRGNLQQCGMNIIKGFLAVSLFTVVPVRLYALSVSLQGTFSAGLTGYGRSIGEVGQDIITELSEIQTLSDVINSSHFGLGIITSPIMLLFCVILEHHESRNEDGGLEEGGQAQADDLPHPAHKAVQIAPWDAEHIKASHRDLNEQNAPAFEVGEKHLQHRVAHEDHAKKEHNGAGDDAETEVRAVYHVRERLDLIELRNDVLSHLTNAPTVAGESRGKVSLQRYG